jgi:hypothetical protein
LLIAQHFKEHTMNPTFFTATSLMRKFGLEPDPWQIEVLDGGHRRVLLNCCRQAGKSTAVAILGLLQALVVSHSLVLLLSRSHRQSMELYRIVTAFLGRLRVGDPVRLSNQELELENGSRIVTLPCREETIRGYSGVNLLIIDEAARVPDDLYRAARPMLAVSQGRMVCLSTPYGKQGFFWDAWARGGDDWKRIEVPAEKIPRIAPAFLESERRALGESWFRQEYCCSFEALEGLVYPDLGKCVTPGPFTATGKKVGGIDFGFKNPFAALWGILDKEDVLWIDREYYSREKPLSVHALHLPREVSWYVDPAGANERAELRIADFNVNKGDNDIRTGIAKVTARIESGRLKIREGACPNLLAEAGLYRYSNAPGEEKLEIPIDEHNHALAALRYLIASIDARNFLRRTLEALRSAAPPKPELDLGLLANNAYWHRQAQLARGIKDPEPFLAALYSRPEEPPPEKPKEKPWLRLDNPALWGPSFFIDRYF